jgi:cytochrome P450
MTVQISHPKQLKPAEAMPGRFGLPFLGETLSIFKDEELYYWQHFQKYGPVFKTRILGQKFAFLVGPEANRQVLLEQADHVSSKLGWFFLKSLFGNGLLFMEGEDHRVARRLLYPAFHGRAIASYFETIHSVVQEFVQDWGNREVVSVLAELRKLTLVVASRLFLGSQTVRQVEQTSQWFLELLSARLALLQLDVPFTTFGRSQQARRKLIQFLRPVIEERKQQGNLAESQAVLGLLLAA